MSDSLTVERLHVGRVALGASSDGLRRVRMVAYTGAEVARLYGRAVFDLDGIEHKERVPLLLEHDGRAVAGYADSVRRTPAGLELSGYVSASTEEGRRVAQLSDEGFPWEASVGLQVLRWEEVGRDATAQVNGRAVSGPVSVGRVSRLLEVSFVHAAADANTAVAVLSRRPNGKPPCRPWDGKGRPESLEAALAGWATSPRLRAEFGGFEPAFRAWLDRDCGLVERV